MQHIRNPKPQRMILNSTQKFYSFRFLLISAIIFLASNTSFAQQGDVNITDFTLSTKEHKVMLDWKTDGTIATNYFEVQKSADGINFKTIALVLGPDPKQTTSDSYGFFDKNLAKNVKQSYYRLVHFDTNGNQQLSAVKVLAKS